MKPVKIAGAHVRYVAPKSWDAEANGECDDLWVRKADGVCESAWRPSPLELQQLNAGASVVLTVFGGQPPVSLNVEGVEWLACTDCRHRQEVLKGARPESCPNCGVVFTWGPEGVAS